MIHDHIYDDELKKENVEERYILMSLIQDAGISREQNRKNNLINIGTFDVLNYLFF